jgi:hypothetical protein
VCGARLGCVFCALCPVQRRLNLLSDAFGVSVRSDDRRFHLSKWDGTGDDGDAHRPAPQSVSETAAVRARMQWKAQLKIQLRDLDQHSYYTPRAFPCADAYHRWLAIDSKRIHDTLLVHMEAQEENPAPRSTTVFTARFFCC